MGITDSFETNFQRLDRVLPGQLAHPLALGKQAYRGKYLRSSGPSEARVVLGFRGLVVCPVQNSFVDIQDDLAGRWQFFRGCTSCFSFGFLLHQQSLD